MRWEADFVADRARLSGTAGDLMFPVRSSQGQCRILQCDMSTVSL